MDNAGVDLGYPVKMRWRECESRSSNWRLEGGAVTLSSEASVAAKKGGSNEPGQKSSRKEQGPLPRDK